jgi:pilus assembly protein CpaF
MKNQVKAEDILKIIEPIAALDAILADSEVWEIMIDSHERVLVDRAGQLEQVPSPFASAEELQHLIDDLFGLYGIQLNADNPIGYLRLPDHSRVMAIVPPNAVDGPHLVLRRIVGPRIGWERVFDDQAIPLQAYDLLKGAIEARTNMLICGGPGSGKTTLSSLIAEMVSPEERMIIVERAYEMQVNHPRVVRLEAGGPAGLSFEEMLTAATRMRPDRLIVGECNGPIAAAVLQHFGSGFDGSITHIHGTSVEDDLNRLESYCLMANLGLGLTEIRYLVASGLQLIVHLERQPDGKRKLVELVELCGIENGRYLLQPLMRYDHQNTQFEFTGVKPTWEA